MMSMIRPTISMATVQLLALSMIAAAIDGVDLQILAMLAPRIAQDWNVSTGAFGPIYSASMAGLIVGSVVLVACASKFGRKPVIVFAICWIGLCTMAMALTTSIPQLLALRFGSCFGLGGIFPLLVIIAHDSAKAKWRSLSVTTIYSGIPVGGFLAGILVSLWLRQYSWQSVLVLSGTLTLCVGLAFLFAPIPDPPRDDVAQAAPIRPGSLYSRLLSRDHRAVTLWLWALFAAAIVMTYNLTNWLPSILSRAGVSTTEAAFVVSMLNLGSIVGGPLFGAVLQRFGALTIVMAALLAAVTIAILGLVIGGVVGGTVLTSALAFVVGIAIGGAYACANAFAASAYPPTLRAAGVGSAQAFGRIWVIISSLVVGSAIIAGASNLTLILVSSASAVLVAAAAWALRAKSRQP